MQTKTEACAPIRRFANAADYRKNFVMPGQIGKYLPGGKHYIDEDAIFSQLALASGEKPNDPVRVRDILAKSRAIETLLPEETAALIQVTDPGLLQEMADTALAVKKSVYDNRIVMFAPLVVTLPFRLIAVAPV